MKGKRVLQSLLVLCMTLFLAPAVVHANDEEAQIGDTKYATLKEAIGLANAGDTIQLLKDVSVAEDLTINKKITITGKNSGTGVYSMTVADHKQIVIGENGDLTAQDILITGNNGDTIILVYGAFTVQPGTTIANQGTLVLGITGNGTFTMNGGTIQNQNRSIGVNNKGRFTMNGGTIQGGNMGVLNLVGTFTMNGGTIQNCSDGVSNDLDGTFTMNGGTIQSQSRNGVVNFNGCLFTMTAGKIADNGMWDIKNMGTFIRTRGTTTADKINNDEEEGAVYREVDPVRNQWKPTTPEEKRSFACRGGEPVHYTAAKENTYEVIAENALQGPKCFVSFDAVKGDYTIARTYDIYPASGKKYSEEKPARICLEVPAALRKDGRNFRMICVSKDGRPFVLTDLDTDPATVTFETSHFYAFALSYK